MDSIVISFIEMLTSSTSLKQDNVIMYVILTVIIGVYIYTRIRNVANIEKVFMKSKKRRTNEFLSELVLLGLFIMSKAITVWNSCFLIIEIGILLLNVLIVIVLKRILKCSSKMHNSVNEIYEIFKFIMIVIADSIVFLILGARMENGVSKLVLVILAGATDLIILRIMESELMENNYSVCFFNEDKKILYAYKRIDDNIILCGDKPKINQATMIKMIDYDVLKKQQFLITNNKKVQKT